MRSWRREGSLGGNCSGVMDGTHCAARGGTEANVEGRRTSVLDGLDALIRCSLGLSLVLFLLLGRFL